MTFSKWDSRLLLRKGLLSTVSKSGYRPAQFDDVYTVTSLYCFFSFNDCILKLGQIIDKKLKLFTCVTSGFFYSIKESFKPKMEVKHSAQHPESHNVQNHGPFSFRGGYTDYWRL